MSTIYHCCKKGKDVNKTLSIIHEAATEKEAIAWLEQKGGGVYRNILHNFSFYVEPKLRRKQTNRCLGKTWEQIAQMQGGYKTLDVTR